MTKNGVTEAQDFLFLNGREGTDPSPGLDVQKT